MRAIAYFANGMGNFVMMMPALQAVSSMTQSGKIDLVLPDEWNDYRKPLIEDIASSWDVIEKIIHYPSESINESDYELWYWSGHTSKYPPIELFIKHMNYRPVPKPAWRVSRIHERSHYMDIAYEMGYEGKPPEVIFPETPVTLSYRKPIFAICNGAFHTKTWQKKTWPYFDMLAKTLKRYYRGSVIGVGGNGELQDVELDYNYAGKITIKQTVSILKQADAFITTDTGLMHIADTLKIKTIALFGSTLASKNAPVNGTVIRSEMPCAPCQDTMKFHYCEDNGCMKAITVGDVMACLRRII